MAGPALVDYLGLILSPAANPAAGDIPVRGVSGGWTTIPMAGASAGSVLQINGATGLPEWGTGSSGIVTTLPTPSATFEGETIILSGQGVHRDRRYLCVNVPGGVGYQWELIPAFLTWTIGDGTSSSFTIAHYLGNAAPMANVVNNTSHEEENPDVTFTDLDHVVVNFGTTVPAINSYVVNVVG